MALTTGTGPLSRFLRFTTQKEPILSSATLVAIALAIVSRFVPLADDDLQLLALILLPFAPAILARLKAWSPASVERTVQAHSAAAYRQGTEDAYRPDKVLPQAMTQGRVVTGGRPDPSDR